MNRIRLAGGAVLLVLATGVAFAGEATIHEQAARELYQVIVGDRMVHDLIDAMMANVRNNEQLAPYEGVVREWVTKVMSSGEFEAKIVDAYAQAFSEEELRELTTFYRSPVGRKALAEMPRLVKRGSEIGAELVQEHQAELEDMLKKRKSELEAGEAKKP